MISFVHPRFAVAESLNSAPKKRGLLDIGGIFSSSSKSTQTTTTVTDSNNQNNPFTSTTSTNGGQGNTSLSLGGGSPLDTAQLVAYTIVGALALGGIYLVTRR